MAKHIRTSVLLDVTESQAIALCRSACNAGFVHNVSKRNKEGFPQWTEQDRKDAIRFMAHQLIEKELDKYPEARIGL
jgi:hypothetical protein